MTSLAYGLDMPYEVQLEHDADISDNYMTILEPQRSPGTSAAVHLLTPGVYMVSLSYNGAAKATLRHFGGGTPNMATVPAGTAGEPRTSAPIKISVQGTGEYLQVAAPSTGGAARATISVIPAATFDEMAESAQGVSVLSEISTLKSTKADKSTLDARVPANTSLRLDTSVGTRIFAGDTMIYGDTGWIEITHLFSEGLSPNNTGAITVRRTTETLEIGFSRVKLLEGVGLLTVGILPSGFRPTHRTAVNSVTVSNSAGLSQNMAVDSSGRIWWFSQTNVGASSSHSNVRSEEELQGGISVPSRAWPGILP